MAVVWCGPSLPHSSMLIPNLKAVCCGLTLSTSTCHSRPYVRTPSEQFRGICICHDPTTLTRCYKVSLGSVRGATRCGTSGSTRRAFGSTVGVSLDFTAKCATDDVQQTATAEDWRERFVGYLTATDHLKVHSSRPSTGIDKRSESSKSSCAQPGQRRPADGNVSSIRHDATSNVVA